MKVIDLLDKIHFGNGNPSCLPILALFADDEKAEIFGLAKGRYLIIKPIDGHQGVVPKYDVYYGCDKGYCENIATGYYREDFFTAYGDILCDPACQESLNRDGFHTVAYNLGQYINRTRESDSNPSQKGE